MASSGICCELNPKTLAAETHVTSMLSPMVNLSPSPTTLFVPGDLSEPA